MNCKDCGWKSVKWKSLNPSGAILFCEYSGERTWEDECCCAWKPINIGITPYTDEDWKKTNADRIRAMTDEELAVWIAETSNCSDWCKLSNECEKKQEFECCINVWLDWLKREVE